MRTIKDICTPPVINVPHDGECCTGSSREEWVTGGGRKVGSSQRLKVSKTDKLAKDEEWERKSRNEIWPPAIESKY